jgi:hypothetical protein
MYKILLSKKHIIKDHSDRFDQFEPVFVGAYQFAIFDMSIGG